MDSNDEKVAHREELKTPDFTSQELLLADQHLHLMESLCQLSQEVMNSPSFEENPMLGKREEKIDQENQQNLVESEQSLSQQNMDQQNLTPNEEGSEIGQGSSQEENSQDSTPNDPKNSTPNDQQNLTPEESPPNLTPNFQNLNQQFFPSNFQHLSHLPLLHVSPIVPLCQQNNYQQNLAQNPIIPCNQIPLNYPNDSPSFASTNVTPTNLTSPYVPQSNSMCHQYSPPKKSKKWEEDLKQIKKELSEMEEKLKRMKSVSDSKDKEERDKLVKEFNARCLAEKENQQKIVTPPDSPMPSLSPINLNSTFATTSRHNTTPLATLESIAANFETSSSLPRNFNTLDANPTTVPKQKRRRRSKKQEEAAKDGPIPVEDIMNYLSKFVAAAQPNLENSEDQEKETMENEAIPSTSTTLPPFIQQEHFDQIQRLQFFNPFIAQQNASNQMLKENLKQCNNCGKKVKRLVLTRCQPCYQSFNRKRKIAAARAEEAAKLVNEQQQNQLVQNEEMEQQQ